MHFWEIIMLQFEKKTPYIALYFKAFYKYCSSIIFKNASLPPIFFLDINSAC